MKDARGKGCAAQARARLRDDEIVEEYAFQEGEAVLLKRKVTKKTVPPDMQAAKMLLEEEVPTASMSDEQLAAEKVRLLRLLKEEEG